MVLIAVDPELIHQDRKWPVPIFPSERVEMVCELLSFDGLVVDVVKLEASLCRHSHND